MIKTLTVRVIPETANILQYSNPEFTVTEAYGVYTYTSPETGESIEISRYSGAAYASGLIFDFLRRHGWGMRQVYNVSIDNSNEIQAIQHWVKN